MSRVRCDLPYVHAYRDRHGRMRCYYRRKGFVSVTLPGEPGSAEFLEAYSAAIGSPVTLKASSKAAPGTIGAICLEYLSSADYIQLAESTRRELRYVLNDLTDKHGDKRVATLEPRRILKMRDALASKPGAANKLIRTLKILLGFAKARGVIKENPALGIKMMKLGRYRSWTDAEIARFEQRWPLGTLERTAYALALYTGQRRTDVARMGWADIAGNAIRLRQSKTGKAMEIRIHVRLAQALQAFRPTHGAATILAGKGGKSLSPVYFGHLMARAIDAAGLPDDCVLHGLRKTTARVLAELGAKSTPITGHMTDAMQREYEADADQAKLGSAAIIRWEKHQRRRAGTKGEGG